MSVTLTGAAANRNSPWFLGAPVSKAIAICAAVGYVAAETVKIRHDLALDVEKVLNEGQYYRLLVCYLTFSSMGELVIGLAVLCPLARRFEREMGSRRFGTFVLFTNALSLALDAFLTQSLRDPSSPRYPGPYPLLGALLLLYRRHTPRLHPRFFGLLGFDLSEKAVTYAFAFQVIFSGGWGTALPTICGALACGAVMSESLPLRTWEFPHVVYAICGTLGGGLVDGGGGGRGHGRGIAMSRRHARGGAPAAAAAAAAAGAGGGGAAGAAAGGGGAGAGGGEGRRRLIPDAGFGGYGGPAGGMGAVVGMGGMGGPTPQRFEPPPPRPPPPEEAVEQLTGMGFEREAVIRALRESDDDVEVAANRLLSGA